MFNTVASSNKTLRDDTSSLTGETQTRVCEDNSAVILFDSVLSTLDSKIWDSAQEEEEEAAVAEEVSVVVEAEEEEEVSAEAAAVVVGSSRTKGHQSTCRSSGSTAIPVRTNW